LRTRYYLKQWQGTSGAVPGEAEEQDTGVAEAHCADNGDERSEGRNGHRVR